MDPTVYLAFFATLLLFAVTPGPAVLLTVAHGVKSGWGDSLKAALGVQAGNGIYLLVSAFGMGAILSTSENLFHAVKWIGAAYLVWLGIRTIRSAGRSALVLDGEKAPLLARPFQQALMTQLANPKSVLFFGALMPQFIQPGHSLVLQYSIFAAICFFSEMPVLAIYGWLAARGRGLFATPARALWRERLSGGALIAVGASLAAIRRSV
ncbi:MAG TPA: LysE family translocator [Solimonas sp.]|nr:LysE family translocator [Solimonas sp.]